MLKADVNTKRSECVMNEKYFRNFASPVKIPALKDKFWLSTMVHKRKKKFASLKFILPQLFEFSDTIQNIKV